MSAAVIALLHLNSAPIFARPFLVSVARTLPGQRANFVSNVAFSFFNSLPGVTKFRLFDRSTYRHVPRLGRRINLFATGNRWVSPVNQLKIVDHQIDDGTNGSRFLPGRFPIRVGFMRSILAKLGHVILYFALNVTQ